MADQDTPKPADPAANPVADVSGPSEYDEFEVGEHKIPWFLWVFFALIISWASIAWYPFFGY